MHRLKPNKKGFKSFVKSEAMSSRGGHPVLAESPAKNKQYSLKSFSSCTESLIGLSHATITTKQSCELLIETFNKEKNLDFTILRFGSLYGPRANKFNFVHQAISLAIKEGKILRKGTGNEIREYIHVSDASYACLSSLSQEYKNSYLMVTGSQRFKIKELLDMINEIMNNKLKIKYLKQRNEGHYESSPYSFKPRSAKKFIGKNEVDIGQGLLDLIYEINSEI